MWKTRNKNSAKAAAERVARKNRLTRRRLGLEIGDRIRITDISLDLKDPNYDLNNAEGRAMRTAELFRYCLGREFTVQGFGRYGFVELDPSANRAVRREFGKYHTIWIEPEFVKSVRKARKKKLSS